MNNYCMVLEDRDFGSYQLVKIFREDVCIFSHLIMERTQEDMQEARSEIECFCWGNGIRADLSSNYPSEWEIVE